MTKLDATKLKGFNEERHRPYTECTQELLDFIQEGTGRELSFDRYIFTQTSNVSPNDLGCLNYPEFHYG